MTDREKTARDAWRRHRKANLNTRRAYDRAVDGWFEHCTADDPLDPTFDEAWETFYLMTPEHAPATFNVRVYGVRHFFRAMRATGLTRNGVVEDVILENRSPQRPQYPEADVQALLSEAEPIDALLVLLLVDAGLNPKRILQLAWSDVGHEHTVKVGGKVIKLSERLDAALHASRRRNGYVMPYRSATRMLQRMRRLCERAGVQYRAVDVLRGWSA